MKHALIIANTQYEDSVFSKLNAPGRDAEDFARVLKSPDIAGFDSVNIITDETNAISLKEIDKFFSKKARDDLLVFYFSGHGVRDEKGALYFAVRDTDREYLASTAIKSDFLREAMDRSRSKQQVIILDCCNSGAFVQGAKADTGGSMGTLSTFQGEGRIILTASDATQFAWEGDKVMGEKIANSLFTYYLVRGLEGKADKDGDGFITVEDLYDYVYEQVVRTSKNSQTPLLSSLMKRGNIVLGRITKLENANPVPLSPQLLSGLQNIDIMIREGAVHTLGLMLMDEKQIGRQRSAKEMLEKISKTDDSIKIRGLAKGHLDAYAENASHGLHTKSKLGTKEPLVQKPSEDGLSPLLAGGKKANIVNTTGKKTKKGSITKRSLTNKLELAVAKSFFSSNDLLLSIPLHRAAYSNRMAWILASMAQLVYESFENDGSARDLLLEKLNGGGFQLIGEFNSPETDTQGFLVTNGEYAVLAFRGTEVSWKTDIMMEANAFKVSIIEGRVHQGFAEAFKSIEIQVHKGLEKIKGLPLYITGHSLGGALALIATSYLERDSAFRNQIAACYTFGSPRVGNREFDREFTSAIYRIVNTTDIVTVIPLLSMGYIQIGDVRFLERSIGDIRYGIPVFRRLFFFLMAIFRLFGPLSGDHAIGEYRRKLEAIAQDRNLDLYFDATSGGKF